METSKLAYMRVVKKESLKWLDVGGIYSISNSKWVSHFNATPKKVGVTILNNDENDLVTTRIQT